MTAKWFRVWLAVIMVGCFATVGFRVEFARQETIDARADAYSFLDGVLKRYENAKTYQSSWWRSHS